MLALRTFGSQREEVKGRRWQGKQILHPGQNFPFGSCHRMGNQGGISWGRGEKVQLEVGATWRARVRNMGLEVRPV